jgi:hypothetical protein
MFVKKYGDICVSIFFLVVGIFLIIGARSFPKSAVVEIGPDFMPTVIGVIIILLSAILLAQSIKGLKEAVAKAEAEGPDDSDYKRVLSSLILSLVYVFVLQPVGFIISTFVYLFGQIFVLAPDEKRTKKDIILYLIIDVVFVLVVFFLFRYGFKIVLPAGIFTINL